ncbi:MAG: L-serine ammonia-lyase, iron-sulfur-dependent, subunit alpha [Coriobacteriia bacterium]|nr:L-serine ammonia-lyase, iron-sulfur-dependent, subunit alpha [Coriobacteriia bacterium]
MAYTSYAELSQDGLEAGSLVAAVIAREAEESGEAVVVLRTRMLDTLLTMREAVARGLAADTRSRSGLVGGDAKRVSTSEGGPIGGTFAATLAAALATAEVNATMGRVVAAPTGGASGILPAVVLTIAERAAADDELLIDALFVAAGIGGIIASRATLSGAAGGCQAEIGSGAAMAAAAAVTLSGGSPQQVGHAASLALQGLMGLICDPVGGLVEVPCVHRNATGAAVALAAAELAMADVCCRIPFDEVVDAQAHVGRSLPPSLRETSTGGLAATPTGRALAASSLPRR